jgi:hypothetical protein
MDRPFRWELNVTTKERKQVYLTDEEIATIVYRAEVIASPIIIPTEQEMSVWMPNPLLGKRFNKKYNKNIKRMY